MKRNPASYMADHKRHTRKSIEREGFAGGKRRGRRGVMGGGRAKRR